MGVTSDKWWTAERKSNDPEGYRAHNAAKHAARQAGDPERYRAKSERWRLKNRSKAQDQNTKSKRVGSWFKSLAQQAKSTAIRKGLSYDLDAEYVRELFAAQRGLCHWLGIPIVPSVGFRDPRRPSLDRLDNSIGYVRGNVVLSTMFANMGRSAADADTFRTFVAELIGHIKAT